MKDILLWVAGLRYQEALLDAAKIAFKLGNSQVGREISDKRTIFAKQMGYLATHDGGVFYHKDGTSTRWRYRGIHPRRTVS